MSANRAGVVGASDPDFKPDPNEGFVYDEEKGVFRKIVKEKNAEELLES